MRVWSVVQDWLLCMVLAAFSLRAATQLCLVKLGHSPCLCQWMLRLILPPETGCVLWHSCPVTQGYIREEAVCTRAPSASFSKRNG